MSDECGGCPKCCDDWCSGCSKRRDDAVDGLCSSCREFYYPEERDSVDTMRIQSSKDLAEAIAALLDLLAGNVPEIAAECVTCADRLRAWARGVTVNAGPEDPPKPPPG